MNRKLFGPLTVELSGAKRRVRLEQKSARRNDLGIRDKLSAGAAVLAIALFCFLGEQKAFGGGTWVPLNNAPPELANIDTMLLLPDGTIMAAQGVDAFGNIS